MIDIHIEEWKDRCNKTHDQRNNTAIPYSLNDNLLSTVNIYYTHYYYVTNEDRKQFGKDIQIFKIMKIQYLRMWIRVANN